MNKSKKLLSLVLAAVLCVSCASVAAYAVNDDCIPSIVVPGIFQSETLLYDDEGNVALNSEGEPYEAPFYLDTTKEIVGEALINALVPIGKLLITQEDKDAQAANAVADVLGKVLMEKNRCDEDGHFIYNIRATKYNDSFRDLSDYDRDYILRQIPMQHYIDLAGEENLYFFSYASLGNMIDTARELYDFIAFVKADSGSDKVNIVPISQGGSVADALFQIYDDEGRSVAEDIDRIVFVVPALDGSILIGEIYQYGLLDDSYELYGSMFPALMGDDDYLSYLVNIIIRIMPNADLNNILDQAVKTLVTDYTRYSTLLWGLCPSGNYPACREMYLTDESAAKIVTQTDWFYQSQLNSDAHILAAKADGVEIFDIVDYNYSLYEIVDSWDDVNADGIIHLDSTSMGAYSLGVDKQLPLDYVTENSNCTDPEHHNHADPHNIVDPCTGLLPETTFYFFNQNHERTGSNDVIMKLASELMCDDNFTSVFSYPDRFPQYNYARNGKGLLKDVPALRQSVADGNYAHLDAAALADLNAGIAAGQAVLDDTTCTTEEFEKGKSAFYTARDKANNYGTTPEPVDDSNNNSFSFDALLLNFLKTVSDILFKLFGGQGFSEMVNNKDVNLDWINK